MSKVTLPNGIKSLFELEQWLRAVFSFNYEREIKARSLEDNIQLALTMEALTDNQEVEPYDDI